MRNNEKREMETDLRSILRIEIERLRACSRGSEAPGWASDPGALGERNGLNKG